MAGASRLAPPGVAGGPVSLGGTAAGSADRLVDGWALTGRCGPPGGPRSGQGSRLDLSTVLISTNCPHPSDFARISAGETLRQPRRPLERLVCRHKHHRHPVHHVSKPRRLPRRPLAEPSPSRRRPATRRSPYGPSRRLRRDTPAGARPPPARDRDPMPAQDRPGRARRRSRPRTRTSRRANPQCAPGDVDWPPWVVEPGFPVPRLQDMRGRQRPLVAGLESVAVRRYTHRSAPGSPSEVPGAPMGRIPFPKRCDGL